MSSNYYQPTALDAAQQKQADYERKEGFKSVLLEEEALRRGYSVRRLTFDTMIITIGNSDLLFKDMNGPSSSAAIQEICDNKYVARSLVSESGVNVPKSAYIRLNQTEEFIRFARQIEYPVVIKPNNLSRGEGVFLNIESDETLKEHLEKIADLVPDPQEKILIEKQYLGDDFRFFILQNQVISVTKRARASVVGDGRHTISELIELKNQVRRQNRNLEQCLIPTDCEALNRLMREGKSLDAVPLDKEVVILRDESNISHGGDSIDFTDAVHPNYHEIALRTIQSIPGLYYAGLDIIAKDITKAPTKDNYVVTEVEFSPGPISMYPWKGQAREMAAPILDFYEQFIEKN